MDRYEVVVIISTLLGMGAVIFKPISSLVKILTRLDETVKNLGSSLLEFKDQNTEAHRRIWKHQDNQDERLDEHEKRLDRIEQSRKSDMYFSE